MKALNYLKSLPADLFDYDPLEPDQPIHLGREALTGDLNRFLLNDFRLDHGSKNMEIYKNGQWLSAPKLRQKFVELAKESRAKKDYKSVVKYVNLATMFDLHPNNGGLLLLRAEAYIQLNQ